jgi:gliding motility-associated-like protein
MDVYKYNPNGFQQNCIHDEDTVFTGTSPQTIQETPFSFDEIASNVLQQVPATANITNEAFTKQIYCESTILCDGVTIKGPSEVCVENAPVIFTASKNEHCPRTVNWHIDNPAADSIRHINDTTIQVFFSKAWQGQITASLEGCSLSDTFGFTANKAMPPLLAADKSIQLCIGENDTLSPGNNYLSYLWQNGSVDQKMVVESPGIYWVKVTDTNGCISSDTITVTALHHPPNNFIATDTTVCLYSSIELQPKGDFIGWHWSTGETTPSITVHQQGTYTISVTDQNYCTGMARVTVIAMPCANHIFFPNAFSPNGDGKNDLFRPVITGNLLNYRMHIYNRWGQKIFESTNAASGWNGKAGSMLQPPGVYVWQAVVQFAGESRRTFKGTIVLVP